MDAKTLAAGSLIVVLSGVAAAVGNSVTEKEPQQLTLKAGATSTDRAVSAMAKMSSTVRPMNATKKWSVINDVYGLHWWCDADAGQAPCPAETVDELDKASGDALTATLTPTQTGDEVTYRIEIKEGEAPPKPELDEVTRKLLGIR